MASTANNTLKEGATLPETVKEVNKLWATLGNRSGDFPPNDSLVDKSAHQTYRSELEFRKAAPKFYQSDELFSNWYDRFWGTSKSFPCTLTAFKAILHQSLGGSAASIAKNFAPHLAPYDAMGKEEYVTTLRQLFEPVDKIQSMIDDYTNRKQFPQESLVSYFNHKYDLFSKAYPKPVSEANVCLFYSSCIRDMINPQVKEKLREFMLHQNFSYTAVNHDEIFRNTMIRGVEQLMREKYRNGALTEAEMVGLASHAPMGVVNPAALDRSLMTTGGINAVTMEKVICWNCGQGGHFKRDCPMPKKKKAASIAPIEELGEPVGYDDQYDYYEIEEPEEGEGGINAFRRTFRRVRVLRPKGKGRGRYGQGYSTYRPKYTRRKGRMISFVNAEGQEVQMEIPEGQVGEVLSSLQEEECLEPDSQGEGEECPP